MTSTRPGTQKAVHRVEGSTEAFSNRFAAYPKLLARAEGESMPWEARRVAKVPLSTSDSI